MKFMHDIPLSRQKTNAQDRRRGRWDRSVADRTWWEGDFDEDEDNYGRYFKNPQRYLRRPICGCKTTNRRQVRFQRLWVNLDIICWQLGGSSIHTRRAERQRGYPIRWTWVCFWCISNDTLVRQWLSPVKNRTWWFFTWKANDAHEGHLVLNESQLAAYSPDKYWHPFSFRRPSDHQIFSRQFQVLWAEQTYQTISPTRLKMGYTFWSRPALQSTSNEQVHNMWFMAGWPPSVVLFPVLSPLSFVEFSSIGGLT